MLSRSTAISLAFVGIASWLTSGCADTQSQFSTSAPGQMIILTWKPVHQDWTFAFGDDASKTVVGISALKKRLLVYADTDKYILLRDRLPDHQYPPASMLDEIDSFAKRYHIHIDFDSATD